MLLCELCACQRKHGPHPYESSGRLLSVHQDRLVVAGWGLQRIKTRNPCKSIAIGPSKLKGWNIVLDGLHAYGCHVCLLGTMCELHTVLDKA